MATQSPGGTKTFDVRGPSNLDDWKRQLEEDAALEDGEQDEDLRAEYQRRLREKDAADVAALGGGSDSDSDGGIASPLGGRRAAGGPSGRKIRHEAGKFDGEFDWAQSGLTHASELSEQNAQLLSALSQREREIERVRTLLDALEPVQGVDPAKYEEILDRGADETAHDVRDVKIVQLAKRARKVTRTLHKERAKVTRLQNEVTRLKTGATARYEEGAGSGNGGAGAASSVGSKKQVARQRREARQRAAMRGEAVPDSDDEATAAQDARAAAQQADASRTVQDLRTKLDRVTTELKQTRSALARELGEGDLSSGAAITRAVEGGGGWRGRAEQITALRSKVQRLQEQLHRQGANGGDTASQRGPRVGGGDDAARAAIGERTRAQRQRLEEAEKENHQLQEQVAAATRRADAARARVHVLEKARKEAAQDVRTLLDKSEGDDELVSALREEVHRLREQAAAAESRAAQAGTASRPAVVRDHAAEARQKEVERSLRRKVEEQKATLARLEDELQQASSGGGGRGAEASGPGVSIARSAREQSLGIEVGRLKETMGALQDKLHQAREREEEQQSRIADLERTCIHLEGRLARRGGQASQAEAGPNVHALHAELKQRGDEVEALRASCRRALEVKDVEIAGLRHTVAEQKHAFEEAMAAFARSNRGGGNEWGE